MATQALYRQWRPQFFRDVMGQQAITHTLQNQIASGRVAHAYLFCGSRGTGKTTSAKILARAVNCQTPQDGEPCGECSACRALADENNLDVVEIDAASNNGVDEIRDLREKIKYPPQYGKYRVYIIDEVHMLSSGAFNALLKTLEEPPAHVVFILATTEPQKLPATVLSRCQRYDFKRIPAQTTLQLLDKVCKGEGIETEEGALMLIARAAEGGARDALSLLDMCRAYGNGQVQEALVREVLGAADRSFLFRFAAALLAGDAAAALKAVDELMRAGREPGVFIRDITQHLRALMLAQTCGDMLADLLETTKEDAQEYAQQAKEVSREKLLMLLDLFLNAENEMKWVSRPRVALEIAAVRACLPEESLRLESLTARMEALEKRFEQGERPAARRSASPAASGNAQAAPAQKVPVVPVADSELWDKTLKALKGEPALLAPLRQGKLMGVTATEVILQYPKGGEIFVNMLKAPARQERMDALLTEHAGRPMQLRAEIEPESMEEVQKADTLRRQVIDAFGRENVQIVDE